MFLMLMKLPALTAQKVQTAAQWRQYSKFAVYVVVPMRADLQH